MTGTSPKKRARAPGLPGDLEELVLMCWLRGGEEYEVGGGGERLLAAARVLAARGR